MTIRRSRILMLLLVALLMAVQVGAVVVNRVTVATTETLIYTAPVGGATVIVRNPGTVSVYLGPTGVLTTTGFELAAGDAMSIPMGSGDTLYGIVASGTNVVHTMEPRR